MKSFCYAVVALLLIAASAWSHGWSWYSRPPHRDYGPRHEFYYSPYHGYGWRYEYRTPPRNWYYRKDNCPGWYY